MKKRSLIIFTALALVPLILFAQISGSSPYASFIRSFLAATTTAAARTAIGAVGSGLGGVLTNAVVYGSTSGSWTFGSAAELTSSSAATLGVGTSSPGKAVEINSSTGNNLRLTYNDSDGSAANYADFIVSSGGNLTITPSSGFLLLGNMTLSSTGADFSGSASFGPTAGGDTRITTIRSRGQVILTPNGAGTGGSKAIIGIGGVTSSQPGLKASGTTLAVRLADDSADAPLTSGSLTASGTVIFSTSSTPASASATGTAGTITWDTSYIYVCTAANTWKRAALSTW